MLDPAIHGEQQGLEDAVRDLRIRSRITPPTWDEVIEAIEYPSGIFPRKLWSYKHCYFVAYQKSYKSVLEIHCFRQRVHDQLQVTHGRTLALAYSARRMHQLGQQWFDANLIRCISAFL